VLGFDYPTPDGTCIHDYVHVNDLAEVHVLAVEHLMHVGGSLALNLSTGKGYSVKEVLAAAHEVTGSPVPWRPAPRRPGDPPVTRRRPVPHPELTPLETSARYCVYGVELVGANTRTEN
jgi:UDP-glucose 4-epimerase